jgi:hypothetical protein
MTPAIINRQQVWTVVGLLLLAVGLPLYAQEADKPVTIITFDVPGAVNGTFPAGLNNDGVVNGYYLDNVRSGIHGFLRDEDGVFTTFDVPGAILQTVPFAVNSEGVVAGNYFDATNIHGFLRAPDGAITTFDVPGAVNGTFPVGLNDKGVVTGTYGDNVGSFHSFVRTRNGVFTKFDPDMVPNLPGIINNAGHDHWILF